MTLDRPVRFTVSPKLAMLALMVAPGNLKAVRLDDESNTVVVTLDAELEIPRRILLIGGKKITKEIEAHVLVDGRGSLKLRVLHAKAKGIPLQIEHGWMEKAPPIQALEEPKPMAWLRELEFRGL